MRFFRTDTTIELKVLKFEKLILLCGVQKAIEYIFRQKKTIIYYYCILLPTDQVVRIPRTFRLRQRPK